MTWCDKLGSTPAVGFGLLPHFSAGAELLTALGPVLDKLPSGDRNRFVVELVDHHSTQFITDEGFRYGVDPRRISVAFNHRVQATPVSASLPKLDILSSHEPYSKLVNTCGNKVIDATICIDDIKARYFNRAGIVSTTVVSLEESPPGIARFINYVSRPWGIISDGFSIQVTGLLSDKEKYTDRCVHSIQRTDDDQKLVTITLDWYRTFHDPQRATKTNLTSAFNAVRDGALEYFEELGEGARFDDEILSTSH